MIQKGQISIKLPSEQELKKFVYRKVKCSKLGIQSIEKNEFFTFLHDVFGDSGKNRYWIERLYGKKQYKNFTAILFYELS